MDDKKIQVTDYRKPVCDNDSKSKKQHEIYDEMRKVSLDFIASKKN